MKRKLLITENQFRMLTNMLTENTDHSTVVKTIENDLNSNYRKAIETYRDGNEYKKRKAFEVKFDGALISGKDLLRYFKLRYNYGPKFLLQVIEDWCNGTIKNGMLSKNIGLYE